jgi:pheromone shutdown protein TraB
MAAVAFPLHHYSEDVVLINLDSTTILLAGTAHVSPQSTDQITRVIEQERPDAVCVELDENDTQCFRSALIGRIGN